MSIFQRYTLKRLVHEAHEKADFCDENGFSEIDRAERPDARSDPTPERALEQANKASPRHVYRP